MKRTPSFLRAKKQVRDRGVGNLHTSTAGPCKKCGEDVDTITALRALGGVWHRPCFVCKLCEQPFAVGTKVYVHEGMPVCGADYLAQLAPKCGGCEKPIVGARRNALGKAWHAECFTCVTCGECFPDGAKIFCVGGAPYCEKDYQDTFCKTCFVCDQVRRRACCMCARARACVLLRVVTSCVRPGTTRIPNQPSRGGSPICASP